MKKVIVSLWIIVFAFLLFPRLLINSTNPETNENEQVIVEADTIIPSTELENPTEEILIEETEFIETVETIVEEIMPIYEGKKGCQIWLTQDTIATDFENDEQITIPKGEKLFITEDSNDVILRCKYSDKEYLVNAQFALINLAQYVPEIKIELDLAKTYNYFNMKGEMITNLTDNQFYTSESATSGDAWLMIEVAEKLYNAQQQFLADGYSIKIYDAYRPYTCTKEFASSFKEFLNTKPSQFVQDAFGNLGMGWFLAQKASSHNYGIAVDMTLIYSETDEELEMPSQMHTLDKSSAREYWEKDTVAYQNADYMYNVMKNNGFKDLKSEWWHFQDNNAKKPGQPIDLSF